MYRFVLALGVLAGCATPPALLHSDLAASASPEALRAVSPEARVSLAPLAQAPQPVLPAPLRHTGPSTVTVEAAMDHGAHPPIASNGALPGEMDHAAMGHTMPPSGEVTLDTMPMAAAAPEALADALDAYLAIQSALAHDQFEGVADHALAFADAWSVAADEAPEADPHFWHMRSEEVRAVATHALALADAADLDAAREAFGELSAPFVALIEAHGAPAGYDLSRFTCGMRSGLPEGGVWLQRGSEAQNPYFGQRMLACGTRDAAIPSRTRDMVMNATPEASGAMDQEPMDHSTGDHD